jgi:hypothetical protein
MYNLRRLLQVFDIYKLTQRNSNHINKIVRPRESKSQLHSQWNPEDELRAHEGFQ